jgi:endoglucanase
MIMKLKNIFYTMSLAGVALIATACQDTDAQINIEPTTAPEFVSVTPEDSEAMLFGEKTIKVKFDKRIGFATKNTSQITLNGKSVKKALVIGADSVLTITADVDFDRVQKLHIPAGLIVGPQSLTYDKAIDITWTTPQLSTSNTAYAMTQQLGWGWNLGNHYETSDVTWGYWDNATPTAATFQAIKTAGAKTVRIPVTWTAHMDGDNVINAAFMDEVAASVDQAIAVGLNVILNTHHDSFETDLGNAANNAEVAKKDSTLIADIWTQVATRFKDYNEQLFFETMNEIHAGDNWSEGTDAEYELLNQWNQYAVDAIRATGGNNSTRWIGVAGYAANIDLTIAHLQMPTDAANRLMVSVHCYDPYNFCLAPMNDDGSVKANSWGHNADPNKSVSGTNEEYIISQLYKLRTAFIDKGIPCYLGEYGCVVQTTDRANAFRKYYLEFFCRAAYLAGIPMMVWDNNVATGGNESNGYIDHTTGAFVADGADIVPMMIKACTDSDESYWFDGIWSKSPAAE